MKHTALAMSQSNLRFRMLLATAFFFILLLLLCRPCSAQTITTWTTAAHLGYAVNQQSTTGFKDVGGSVLLLDLLKYFDDGLELGMRSIAQGGEESSNEYYRMGVGPLVSKKIAANWRLQASISFFNETANDATQERAYKSQGRSYQVGWERTRELVKNVELAWGGFYMMHQGNINLTNEKTPANTASTRFSGISTNRGTTRGVEMALRFKL